MKKISGFTFIHNALSGGYPIAEAIAAVRPYVDEVVVVECQSTDKTKELLEKIAEIPVFNQTKDYDHLVPVKILEGEWGSEAGETLRKAHSKYIECDGNIIIHFEADEVYDDTLIKGIAANIHSGLEDIAVYRLQLEQNFQRCRWYPELVHRVFPKHAGTQKEGHTTNRHDLAFEMTPRNGYLWDITNCFRDNWLNRIRQQAEMRKESPNYLMESHHAIIPPITAEEEAQKWLYGGRHWTWTNTPFAIPEILRPLVGKTKYDPSL